jgi:hypothetical protein
VIDLMRQAAPHADPAAGHMGRSPAAT